VNGVRPDGRQAEDLGRLGDRQRLDDAVDYRLCLRIARLRVELRRWQDEYRRGARERLCERRRILHLGEDDLAPSRGPHFTFRRVTHNGANRLASGEQSPRERATNLAGDARDYIHRDSPLDLFVEGASSTTRRDRDRGRCWIHTRPRLLRRAPISHIIGDL
jgi:hypothetical protein